MRCRNLIPLALVACVAGVPAANAAPGTARVHNGQGQAGFPTIPEPMIFDMVRQLGAARGELEANVLVVPASSGRPVEWAPEVELAVADGLALELELPMAGSKVEAVKLGIQGTIGTGFDRRLIHGIQYLGTVDRHGKWQSSLLYLAGLRYDRHWTSMTMIGLRAPDTLSLRKPAMLLNQSVFRDVGKRTTAGVEVNHVGGNDGKWLLVPQLHQRIGHNVVLQMGAGVEKPRQERRTAIAALRVVREF